MTQPPDCGITRPAIGLLLIHIWSDRRQQPVQRSAMFAIGDIVYNTMRDHWIETAR